MKKLIFIPLILIALAACSGPAIFYTLENEQEILDSNNFKATTPVNRIIKYTDTAANDYYVTHGKQLWYSRAAASQGAWSSVNIPSGYSSHYVIPSIAVFGTRLYYVISDNDTNYKTSLVYVDTMTGSSTTVFTLSKEDAVDENDFYFYELYLFPVDGDLYISKIKRLWNTQSSDSSTIDSAELLHYASGTNPAGDPDGSGGANGTAVVIGTPDITGETFGIRSMAGNAGGVTVMVLNETGSGVNTYSSGKVFRSINDTDFTEVTMTDDYAYNKLAYTTSGGGLFFLSTRTPASSHPILYSDDDGATWTKVSNTADDVQFSSFVDISGIQADTILVGTRGDVRSGSQTYYNGSGYYELDISTPTAVTIRSNTFSKDTNYSSTDLRNATIMDFLYDSVHDRVFATTSSYGLWLNEYSSDDSDRIWYQE